MSGVFDNLELELVVVSRFSVCVATDIDGIDHGVIRLETKSGDARCILVTPEQADVWALELGTLAQALREGDG